MSGDVTLSNGVSGMSFSNMAATLQSVGIFAPASGATVSPASSVGDILIILTPAATLTSLTVIVPVAQRDGQKCIITSTQAVTLLTVTPASGVIAGALASLSVNGYATFLWSATNATWYRIG